MSRNQPWRGWEPSRRGRGRGREGDDDDESARYLKRVRPATVGDAIRKSSPPSSTPSPEDQPTRSEGEPIRAAMPINQPGWGWGAPVGGHGREGGVDEGDVDEGAADSEEGRPPTLPLHLWPALSSSTKSAPTPLQTRPQLEASTDAVDSKQGLVTPCAGSTPRSPNSQPGDNAGAPDLDQVERLPEEMSVQDQPQCSEKNTPSTSSPADSTPRSPNSQPGDNAGAPDLDQVERLPDEKSVQDQPQCSEKNTLSPSSPADSTPRSLNSQPGGNVGAADLDQVERLHEKSVQDQPQCSEKNTPSPSSLGDSTPRSPNSQLGGNAGAADLDQVGCLHEEKSDHLQCSEKNTPSPSSPADSTQRLQPAPSSGSDGTPPSNQSKKSEICSGKKLSYIGVFERDRDKLDRLASKLTTFLDTFTEDGGAFPYYRAELAAIKLRSPFSLTIQFKHIIKEDIDLAFQMWKYQGNKQDWILPAVQNFLKLQNYDTENEIMSKTQLTLFGFPSTMKKVTDVLQNATYSLELLGERACEAKAEGKLVVQLFFVAAFGRHLKDLSWDGQFSASDMWLVNNVEIQIGRPCIAATASSRLRDLKKGGEELLPFFKGPSGYPAYFAQLEEDLQEASANKITEPWCAEYFCFHMASLPSFVRRNLELALHYISKNISIELGDIFEMLTSGQDTDWQLYIEKSQCKALTDVLTYVDPHTGMKVLYENNIGGLVKYKRHFLEHVVFGKIFDMNEVELFGAKKFPKHLPGAVKLLLERNKMVACFGVAWSSVKSSRFDGRDTPTKR